MVAVLAAFADGKRVAVVHGIVRHLIQFEAFPEVGSGGFQAERRFLDKRSAVAADGIGERAVLEGDDGLQAPIGRRNCVILSLTKLRKKVETSRIILYNV